MRSRLKTAGAAAVGLAGGALSIASQVSATEAASNLTSYLKVAGIKHLPSAVAGVPVDVIGLFGGLALLALGTLWFFADRPPDSDSTPLAERPTQAGLTSNDVLVPDDLMVGHMTYIVVRFSDLREPRRRYLFSWKNTEGARTEFFLSPSNVFTLTAVDRRGGEYSVEAPTGRKGVPIADMILLGAGFGVGKDSTTLLILVDGEVVAHRKLPFRIDVGGKEWGKGTLGANDKGEDGGGFEMYELINMNCLPSSEKQNNICKAVMANWQIDLQD